MTGGTLPPAKSSRKIAGLPLWGWLCIALVVVVGVVGAVVASRDDASPATAPTTSQALSRTTLAETDTTASDTTDSIATEPVDTIVDVTVPAGPDAAGEVAGSPVGQRGDRDRPVSAGSIADIGGGWRLQVLGVVPDATAQIQEANEFNDPPPAGSTFTMINVALGYYGLEDPVSSFNPTISAVDGSNVELASECGVLPDELELFTEVFAGGVLTGNICFVTTPANVAGLQLYARGDFFTEGEVFMEVATPASTTPLPTLSGPQTGASSTPARLSATPIGTAADVGEGWSVTATGAARDITDQVMSENSFNDPPPDGFRFIGVDVTYAFNGTGTGSGFTVTTAAVGDSNVSLSDDCGVIPAAIDVFTDVFAGGSVSGSLCFVVPVGSTTITLYSSATFGSTPIMFATT